jgi:hypothetical protein
LEEPPGLFSDSIIHFKMKTSMFVQAWLSYLADEDADRFLKMLGFSDEYEKIERPPGEMVGCETCKSQLFAPDGSYKIFCEKCRKTTLLKAQFFCMSSGSPNSISENPANPVKCAGAPQTASFIRISVFKKCLGWSTRTAQLRTDKGHRNIRYYQVQCFEPGRRRYHHRRGDTADQKQNANDQRDRHPMADGYHRSDESSDECSQSVCEKRKNKMPRFEHSHGGRQSFDRGHISTGRRRNEHWADHYQTHIYDAADDQADDSSENVSKHKFFDVFETQIIYAEVR